MNNDARIDQLRTLYTALRAYKEKTGEWPPDVESVRGRYMELLPKSGGFAKQSPEKVGEAYRPYVGFPPLTGPNRVEYFFPPLDGKVILRSFGHYGTPRGWSRQPVTITMDVTVDGVVSLGTGRITEFGAGPG